MQHTIVHCLSFMSEIATFAAGCFWGVELAFKRKFPSIGCRVGYTAGHQIRPNYRQVCAGNTGHAEAVQITFDPSIVKYKDLVDFFYRMHDPTTVNRQGNDSGSQYRSGIYTHSDDQHRIAMQVTEFAQSKYNPRKIVTEIKPATEFFDAEEYHQEYLFKNPNGYHCASHFERFWDNL